MNNFFKRLLTTLCLLPLAVFTIFLDPIYFEIVIYILVSIAIVEWYGLTKYSSSIARYCSLFAVLIILVISIHFLSLDMFSTWHGALYYAWLLLWCYFILAILMYPKSHKLVSNQMLILCSGLFIIICFAVSIISVQNYSSLLLVYVLSLIWSMDIGAYIFGRKYGKNKILPAVSPGKSYEGLLGGSVFLLAISVVYWYLLPDSLLSIELAVYCYLVSVLSVLGDLFESMLKRMQGTKDSGAILAGHGGVLDRLDSLLFTMPLFALGIQLFV